MVSQHATRRLKSLAISLLVSLLSALCPTTAFAINDYSGLVVSLGDSYSSGEGNDPYYGQDGMGKYSNEDWLAHRSTTSWPGQLSIHGTRLSKSRFGDVEDAKWYFYASSGAVALNVYAKDDVHQQKKSGSKRELYETGPLGTINPIGVIVGNFDESVRIQLKAAEEDLGERTKDVEYVTMTIGGNDIDFAKIVTECAVRSSIVDRDMLVNSLNNAWYNFDRTPLKHGDNRRGPVSVVIPGVGIRVDEGVVAGQAQSASERMIDCYARVREVFPNATILVAGYPQLMNDSKQAKYEETERSGPMSRFLRWLDWRGSDYVGFSDYEAGLVNGDCHEFNNRIEQLIERYSKDHHDDNIHFVSVEEKFKGRGAYTDGAFIYGISLAKSEDLKPYAPSAGSFHPNQKGVQAYRDAVQEELTKLEESKSLVPSGKEAVDVSAIFTKVLDELKEEAQASSKFFDLSGLRYQFADFDGDGVDDLFVNYLSGPHRRYTSYIYKVRDGVAECIFEKVCGAGAFARCYPETKTIVFRMMGYKAMQDTWHYQYMDGVMVQRAAEFDGRDYNGSLSYELAEDVVVTEDEYLATISELEKGSEVQLLLESSW